MKKTSRIYERLADLSVLSNGSVPGVPLIEIISDKRVLVENHHGVCKYTREQVGINTQLGIIEINGNNLHIKQMSTVQLSITGRIVSLNICRSSTDG